MPNNVKKPEISTNKGTFSDRLSCAITAGPDKGRVFAKRAGVSYSTIHNYLTSTNTPNLEILVKLAKATETNLQWLATGQGKMRGCSEEHTYEQIMDVLGYPVNLSEFYFIPVCGSKIEREHNTAMSNERPRHQMPFNKFWVDNILGIKPEDLAVINVKGDSMHGEINDRDLLLVNTYDRSLHDGIYVLKIDGNLIVKRIQKLMGGIIKIISANTVYESFDIDLNNFPDNCGIIGRVVWFGRPVP